MSYSILSPAVPGHISPEVLWEGNYADFLCEGSDPYQAAARLHDGPGIIWATNAVRGKPAWIFTQHQLISEGFANWESFSSDVGSLRTDGKKANAWSLLPVEADPPNHHYYREVLRPFFTPKAIHNRGLAVQSLCDDLIDQFIDRKHCEFVKEFSSILPNAIVLSLMGMPQEMLPVFLAWEDQLIHGATAEERIDAGNAIIDYMRKFIEEQKKKPGTDLMAAILSGKVADRPFTEQEIFGICYLLFVAGLDTTTASLGWTMHYLAQDPELQNRLRNNPQDIPLAIEEFTRAFGVSAPARTVAQDMVFHGVTMKKGDPVLLPTYLAGRDPRAFENPHIIDIDKRARHVTFGLGRHLCLGVHLAKREMGVMLGSFLSRMNHIQIMKNKEFSYQTSSTIGITQLHLEWTPI